MDNKYYNSNYLTKLLINYYYDEQIILLFQIPIIYKPWINIIIYTVSLVPIYFVWYNKLLHCVYYNNNKLSSLIKLFNE